MCNSLEYLKLTCYVLNSDCLITLDPLCPNLKRIEIEELSGVGDIDDQEDVPMEIVHEIVEEIVLRNFSRKHMYIACTNLKRLIMEWGLFDDPSRSDDNLIFPTLECPQLQCLELSGYVNMLPEIPLILLVLPSMTTLKCGFLFF